MRIFKKYLGNNAKSISENFGVQILNLGHNVHPPNVQYPDVDHPEGYYFDWKKGRYLKEYQIIYITKGEGIFEANGLPPQQIGAGTVFLLFPDVWHRFRPKISTGWEEYWVGFTGEYAKYLLEQKCFSPENPIIDVFFIPEFLETFSNLIETIETDNVLLKKMSSFHLINLLGIAYASVLKNNNGLSHKKQTIHEMQNEIHKQWNQNIDFELLCDKFKVSYSWFRKSFKEIFDTPPNQYLLMLRLRNAARIIQETDLSISEVAFECGFHSEHYFSRVFKQKMRLNPSDVRKDMKDK
ncbi:AraC family transcriptional regulator [Zobellia amurskyensis]|uniref:AraC family transcriptional regulator n=1 Tax=Zobellia amurskyensis TaxID=248905 RepID=A0A7X2ZV73_9FLAO|nr:AraC family transcriptional regulator [Zobellia amurskyensis]MUH36987.1 AraC family transcriptional regulator [Zobellia amurskyensis]